MERGRKDWIRIQRKPALSEILRTAGAAITPARVLRAPPPPLPSERSDLRARRTAGFAQSRRRCDDGNSRGDGGTRQVTQPCSTHP